MRFLIDGQDGRDPFGSFATGAARLMAKRQYPSYGGDGWGNSTYIIRYAIVAFVVLGLSALFLVAYLHARSRMRKGLPPLRYHGWLVRGRQGSAMHGQQQHQHFHAQGGGFAAYPPRGYDPYTGQYPMYAMAPPAYNSAAPKPPEYAGPVFSPPPALARAKNGKREGHGLEEPAAAATSNLHR